MPDTILVTGITGFIAKRIALDLLNAGYAVRGSLRSAGRADEVRDALRPHLGNPSAIELLTFVELDLGRDTGWDQATAGVAAVLHTASPFPMTQPNNEDELIRPAIDGTLRALRAAQAAGATRVILTSSLVAMIGRDFAPGETVDELTWSEPDHPINTAYDRSKTLAEKAAWDFVKDHPEMQLTTINPGLVIGTPLDRKYGTSLELIERIFNGSDPAVPDVGFAVVDVSDVSSVHIAALSQPETAGKRYIAAADWVTLPQIAAWLRTAYPDRKIPKMVAPKLLLRVLALFDKSIKTVLPVIGRRLTIDNRRAQQDMGIAFVPAQESVLASAKFLADTEHKDPS